jgi:hypothetical protein
MNQQTRKRVAIIGSGNIGTDLMIKVIGLRTSMSEMGALVGIDPESDGLKRAARMGVATTHEGVDGLTRLPGLERDRHRVRCHLGGRPQAPTTLTAGAGQAHDRPDPGGDRPLCDPGRQRRPCISTRRTSTW